MTAIRSPIDYFADLSGRPNESGTIKFGVAGQDPDTSPITVYWDAALTQVATQPLTMTAGYIVHSGSRAQVFTAAASWSVRTRDRSGSQIDYFQNVTAAVLAGDLALPSGAGSVGYSDASTYPDGTAGKEIQNINKGRPWTPFDFDAIGDHQLAFVDVTLAASSKALTVNAATFTAADVGKYIFIPRCGPSGGDLVTTIAAYVSTTSVTLTDAAVKGVTARHLAVRWGTNDGPALQAMFDHCAQTGDDWFIPPGPSGVYLTAQALNVRQSQNDFTNGRQARPPSWQIDNGATIKACAAMDYVIRFGAEDTDYSQYLRNGVIRGGIIDCSFLAAIGIDVPFGEVTTVEHAHTKNIKTNGLRFGSLTAPAASGGNQANFCSSSRDTDAVTITGITKANPAVVTAPDHNFGNGDTVTLVVTGMTEANLKFFRIAGVTQDTFQLVNTDSSAWTTFTAGTVARCMPSMRVPRFVSAATQANPCVVTFSQPHGFSNGDVIYLADLGGMTQIGTTSGPYYTVAGATSTTIQLSGINSTGYTAYTGNGFAIEKVELANMQTWLWCENASDVDTAFNQISGVRIGVCADPANSTGYDQKHIKNHMFNRSEAGEMLAAYILGGDCRIVASQVDGPFRHAFWWNGPRNKTVACCVNYDSGLPTYDLYATVHRIETGATVKAHSDNYKSGSSGSRILDDVSGTYSFLWHDVERVNVFANQASGWATATDPVLFGTLTIAGKAVSYGAADSGGAGYKLLRVAN